MSRVLVCRAVGVCLLVALAAVPAAAQVSTGKIFGKATDGSGAVLPGVTVTITSSALLQAQAAVTAASGGYRFPTIPIGPYTVTFDLAGFKKLVHEGIVIQTGFNAEINGRMEIASVHNPRAARAALRVEGELLGL